MKALIIEKSNKRRDVFETYLNWSGIDHVAVADSIRFGIKQLVNMFEADCSFDYLVLGMELPEFSNSNKIYKNGGLMILREIRKRKIPIKVIIVTGEESINLRCCKNMTEIVGVIKDEPFRWQASEFKKLLDK